MGEQMVTLPDGTVDLRAGRGRIGGREVRLTGRELGLLELLARGSGEVVDRETLERGMGLGESVDRSVLDVAVYRLRRKVEIDPSSPRALLAAHGTGYRLVMEAAGHLPPAPSMRGALFGREREQSWLREHAAESCITLVGPPGVGKTSLARWLARQQDAVAFVELVPCASLEAVLGAVADALGSGLRAGTTEGLQQQVLAALDASAPGLLVLDNAEHLLDEVRAFVRDATAALPRLRILVTSRMALGVSAEQVLWVEPLDAPDAVALLVDRAAASGVALDPGDPTLGTLVEGLDRLPLAIELVAARTRILKPRQILDRLDQRFRLLSAGAAAGSHHSSLAETLSWSWDLLDEEAQRALARASVFRTVLRPAPALAVLGAGAAEQLAVLEAASLVTPSDEGPRLLQSVRDYAAARLEALGLRAEAELAHARSHVALLRNIVGVGQARHEAVLDAVDAVLPEVLATLRVVSVAPELPAEAALLVLDRFEVRGALQRFLAFLEPALQQVPEGWSQHSELLWARAACCRRLGRLTEGLASIDAALSAQPPARLEALMHGERAALLSVLQRHDEAVAAVERGLGMDELSPQNRIIQQGNAAVILQRAGVPLARVEGMLREAIRDARARGERWEVACTQAKLGGLLHEDGRLDEAGDLLLEALHGLEALGAEARTASVLHDLAAVRAEQGSPEAEPLLERAAALFATYGYRSLLPYARQLRAHLRLQAGRFDDAVAMLEQPTVLALDGGLVALSVALALAGRPVEAREALDGAAGGSVSGLRLASAHVAVSEGREDPVITEALHGEAVGGAERLFQRLLATRLG